jgi:hypothetical protein
MYARACPCCGYRTLDPGEQGSYEICSICFWEDDPVQLADPDYAGGANHTSLRQAQRNFIEFGANDERDLKHVRPPNDGDVRDADWHALPPA